MKFRFRIYTGASNVKEVSERMNVGGIETSAGTECVYGSIYGADLAHCMNRINQAVRFKIASPRELTACRNHNLDDLYVDVLEQAKA
jgi:hypothetical protein